MNGIVFYIGLGAGLAAACGLRPFLPLLLAGALGTSDVLGVDFGGHSFHFLQSGWWLLAVTVAMVLSYALQILLKLAPVFDTSRRPGGSDPLAAALAGLALGAGAALFGGTLAAHGDAAWPGIIGGIVVAALAQRAFWPVIARARTRLPDAASREAATIYLDSAALVLAALVALLHPLGYVAIVGIAWFAWRGRSRGDEKYAGLRILGR
jgi:hypothetical protein